MARIGFVELQGGVYVGVLKTLSIRTPIRIEPVPVTAERAPDWRVVADDDIDLGAGWTQTNAETGERYINLQFAAPEFGRIYVNFNPASGVEHGGRIALMWNVKRGKAS